MSRQIKKQTVESLKTNFAESDASFLVGYKGLDVQKLETLRGKLREQGGQCKVAKVTLIRRAVDGLEGIDPLMPLLKDQVALVFGEKEPPAIAKILDAFAKENEQLKILAAYMDSRVLGEKEVSQLASLPSREVLLGMLCGALQAPVAGMTRVLNMLILRLLFALKEIEKKKGEKSS